MKLFLSVFEHADRRVLAGLLLAALAALIVGGLFGSTAQGARAGAGNEGAIQHEAHDFAECHALAQAEVPGPPAPTHGRKRNPTEPGQLSKQVRRAHAPCGKAVEHKRTFPSRAEHEKALDALERHAGCMRRHGVKLPPLEVGEGFIGIRLRDPKAPDKHGPLERAEQKCRNLLPSRPALDQRPEVLRCPHAGSASETNKRR